MENCFENHMPNSENFIKLRSDPDAEDILKIFNGGLVFAIVNQALQMGIFDDIEGHLSGMSVTKYANKYNYDIQVTQKLFSVLTSVGLLKKEWNQSDGDYKHYNTSGTSRYLTRSQRPSLVEVGLISAKMLYPMMQNLPVTLKSGSTVPPVKAPDPSVGMSFMLSVDGLSATAADALISAFDLQFHQVAVDIGGGLGRLARTLARKYPDMQVYVLDRPPVVMAAEKHSSPDDVDVTFVHGDFLKDDLPSADLYIMSHVLHMLGAKDTDILLQKLYNKLPAGGRLLVAEKVLNEDKTGPKFAITNDLCLSLLHQGGRERTLSEYKDLFHRHGFNGFDFVPIQGLNYIDAILLEKSH